MFHFFSFWYFFVLCQKKKTHSKGGTMNTHWPSVLRAQSSIGGAFRSAQKYYSSVDPSQNYYSTFNGAARKNQARRVEIPDDEILPSINRVARRLYTIPNPGARPKRVTVYELALERPINGRNTLWSRAVHQRPTKSPDESMIPV